MQRDETQSKLGYLQLSQTQSKYGYGSKPSIYAQRQPQDGVFQRAQTLSRLQTLPENSLVQPTPRRREHESQRDLLSKSIYRSSKPSLVKKDASLLLQNVSKKRVTPIVDIDDVPNSSQYPMPRPFYAESSYQPQFLAPKETRFPYHRQDDSTARFKTSEWRPSEYVDLRPQELKQPVIPETSENLAAVKERVEANIQFSQYDQLSIIVDRQSRVEHAFAFSTPFAYVPSQHLEVPRPIQEAIARLHGNDTVIYELSQVNKTAFICVSKTLFVWDFTNQSQPIPNSQMHYSRVAQNEAPILGEISLEYEISDVKELTSKNMSSDLAKFLVQDSIVLLVATAVDIRLVIVSKGDGHHLKVQESSTTPFVFSQNNNCRVTTIVEFTKLGRVFIGLSTGRVLDLLFETSEHSWLPFANKNKSLNTRDKSRGMLGEVWENILPEFMKTTKRVKSLEIDEQRNLLYALCEQTNGRHQGNFIIVVYNLGLLGNKTELTLEIFQHDLSRKVLEFQGKSMRFIGDQYDVACLIPIRYSESQSAHLKVLTNQGELIFIRFEQVERSTEAHVQEQQEKLGLQNDLLVHQQPSSTEWSVVALVTLPAMERFRDNRSLTQNITENPLKEHSIPVSKNATTNLQKVTYDHHLSMLIGQVKEEGEIVVFERNSRQTNFPIQGQFMLFGVNGRLIEQLKAVRAFKPCAPSEILATLGYLPIKEKEIWCKRNPQNEYSSTDPLSSQVFVQNSLTIITETKLVQLYQVRPVDTLYTLLNEMARNSGPSQPLLQSMDDFVQSYNHLEVCTMLVQILVDSNSTFVIVRRIEEMLRLKSRLYIQQQDQARNASVSRGQQVWQGRPWNLNHSLSPINRAGQFNDELSNEDMDIFGKLFVFRAEDPTEMTKTHPTSQVRDKAFELLMRFGDVVSKDQHETCRHTALYLYLSRLLKPIWALPIVARPNLKTLQGLKSNLSLFAPIERMVEALFKFIESNKAQLHGFNNAQLDDLQLGQHEKESLKSLCLSLERCLDIFQFLCLIDNDLVLSKLGQNLSKENQDQLASFTFSDLMTEDANEFVQATVMAIIKITTAETGGHAVQLIEQRLQEVKQRCRTFYMAGDNQVHLGELLLQRAITETDERSRNEQMQKAAEVFSKNPEKVNLDEVIPQLIKQKSAVGVVHLCMLKAKKVSDTKVREEIFDIVAAWFWALHRAMEGGQSDEVKKDKEVVGNTSMYNLFFFHFEREGSNKPSLMKEALNIVQQFKSLPVLEYVFKCLLTRGTCSDILFARLSNEQVVTCINSTFDARRKVGKLTVGQFAQMERLLPKVKEFTTLAKLTLQVVCDQVHLKQDVQPDQTTDLQPFQYTCLQRQQKLKQVLAHIEGQLREPRQIGSVIAQDQNQVISNLRGTLECLTLQLQCRSSAQAKLKLINEMPADSKTAAAAQNRNIDAESKALQDFVAASDLQIYGIQDLNLKAQELKLHEIRLGIIKTLPQNEDQAEKRKRAIESIMRDYVNDLVLFCGYSSETLFNKLACDAKQFLPSEQSDKEKELLIRLVRQKYPDSQSPTDPLSKVMMQELGMKGSQLIKMEDQANKNETIRLSRILKVFRSWIECVDIDDKQREDFMNQGTSLIKEILDESLPKQLKDTEMQFTSDDYKNLTKLLAEVTAMAHAKHQQYWPSQPLLQKQEVIKRSLFEESARKPNFAQKPNAQVHKRSQRSLSPANDAIIGSEVQLPVANDKQDQGLSLEEMMKESDY